MEIEVPEWYRRWLDGIWQYEGTRGAQRAFGVIASKLRVAGWLVVPPSERHNYVYQGNPDRNTKPRTAEQLDALTVNREPQRDPERCEAMNPNPERRRHRCLMWPGRQHEHYDGVERWS